MGTLLAIACLGLPSLLIIAFGLVALFKQEWAWRLVESIYRPAGPPLWDETRVIDGLLLILAGLGIGLYLLIEFLH